MKQRNTEVMPCTCVNAGQDTLYGPGRRVFNKRQRPSGSVHSEWRCTVCASLKMPGVTK